MLTEAGNPKSKLPLAPLSKIREVLRQIALQKQHYKPPESATKTPLDCLRELVVQRDLPLNRVQYRQIMFMAIKDVQHRISPESPVDYCSVSKLTFLTGCMTLSAGGGSLGSTAKALGYVLDWLAPYRLFR
jgi:hypothetical protein